MRIYQIPSDNPDASTMTRSVTEHMYANIRQPCIQDDPPLATQNMFNVM
jgi:hypothetical protein